jgi:hypothetical protein
MNETPTLEKAVSSGLSRRRFFGIAGALAGAGLLSGVSSCKKTEEEPGTDLGSSDTGIFNYVYVLEQIEAAFYTQVVAKPYVGFSLLELAYFTDIRDHEIAHREFIKNILGGAAIPTLTTDFSSVNFQSRTSVLDTAIMLEDLGVSAYNGAGQFISNPQYLELLGKIVSVEARHAAALRDIKLTGTFADDSAVHDATGLDLVRIPSEVLPIASTFIKEKLNAANLPNS